MHGNMFRLISASILGTVFLLQGCANSDLEEIRAYIAQEKAKKGPRIEALPTFPPYVSSIYSAAGLRSPFEPPREVEAAPQGSSVAAPDPNRKKEYLERFAIAELRMVGTMEQEGIRWALINDGSGEIRRVKAGNYMGRNHGLIKDVQAARLNLIEVVVDGTGGWIERPRTVSMATQ